MSKRITPRKKLNNTSVEVYTREIRKLDGDLQEWKRQVDDFRKSNKKLQLDKDNLARQVRKLKADNEDALIIDQYENEIKGLRQKNRKHEDLIRDLEERINSLEKENKRLKTVTSVKEREIQNLQQEVRGLKEKIHELNTLLVDKERMKGLTEDFREPFRCMLEEFQEKMFKEFRDSMYGLKSDVAGVKSEMKSLKPEIIDEVTEVVRIGIGEKCETRVINLNHVDISSHLPMTSWE